MSHTILQRLDVSKVVGIDLTDLVELYSRLNQLTNRDVLQKMEFEVIEDELALRPLRSKDKLETLSEINNLFMDNIQKSIRNREYDDAWRYIDAFHSYQRNIAHK